MNVFVSLYIALLFLALTPGVLLTLPKGGSKLLVAAVHGLVFAVVYQFTHKLVLRLTMSMDGFQSKKLAKVRYTCEGTKKGSCPSNMKCKKTVIGGIDTYNCA